MISAPYTRASLVKAAAAHGPEFDVHRTVEVLEAAYEQSLWPP